MDRETKRSSVISKITNDYINQNMAETLNEVLEIVEATVNDKFEHLQDTNNPHNVTKEQVGLGSVDNTADIDKPVSNATSSAINTLRQEMISASETLKQELADRLSIQNVREGSIDDLQETGIYHVYNTVTGYPAELFEGLGAVSSCIVKVYRAVSSDSYSVIQEIYLANGVIQHSPLGIRMFAGIKWHDWETKNYTLTDLSRFTAVSEAATVTACQTFLAADGLGNNIRRVPLSELQTSGGSTTGNNDYDLSSLPKATVTLDITTGKPDVSDIVAIFKMANTDELDTITTEGKYRLCLKMIIPGGENTMQIGYMTVTKTGIETPQTETVSLQINQIVRLHPNHMHAYMVVLETIPIAAYRYKTQGESGNFSNWSSWQNDELIDYLNFGSIPLPLSKVGQVKENGIIGADTTILIANGDGKEISKIPFDSIHRMAVSSTGQVSDIAFVQCFKADGTAVNIPVADFKAFIKS